MKIKTGLWALIVVLGIPWLACRCVEYWAFHSLKAENAPQIYLAGQTKKSLPDRRKYEIPVLLGDGSSMMMPLEEYLVGVVLGEMPASFSEQALKAQAVVARTYTMKRNTQSPKHSAGTVCTDSACCQAYVSPADYSAEQLEKIQAAVHDTKGLVLTYEEELIDATYFSCSGGRTEAAVAVWGADVPYLQAVDSPGEEQAKVFTDTVSYSVDEFAQLLNVKINGPQDDWFSDITHTDGGGVATMTICGTQFTGTQLRKELSLRSTAFYITALGDTVTITTRGYGHRVGMSQYGAEAMAQSGSDFRQILAHYYPGTTLENWTV